MIRTFTIYLILIGAFSLLISSNKAMASHAQGAELIYINTAPNVYVIKYKLFRDCTGITLGPSETITYRAPGCNATARTVSAQRISQTMGTPYCSSIVPQCTTGSLPNFEENVFTATITLPTLCQNWILSARIGNRNESRNLNNGSTEWLFTETLINNVATQTNNSPVFGNFTVPFVAVNRLAKFNYNIKDPDGDSLVYTLAPALNDLNDPVTYANYPAGVSPAPLSIPYPAGVFSATNPIITQTPVMLDRFTGDFSFMPLSYIGPSVPTSQGRDKYVLSMQVDEYRMINFNPVKIGHVRRDILISVYDGGINYAPSLDSVLVRSMKYAPGAIIETGIGQPLEMRFFSLDTNPQDIVKITSNNASVFPTSTFTVNTAGARQSALFSWTPTAADISSRVYIFDVTVTDNSCPINESRTFRMGIKVSANGPTGINNSLPTGSFTAYPNPANGNQISFKLENIKAGKNAEVIIYSMAGKVVDRIQVKAGEEQILWNKKADLPAGVYFARLSSDAGNQTQAIKLIHLK